MCILVSGNLSLSFGRDLDCDFMTKERFKSVNIVIRFFFLGETRIQRIRKRTDFFKMFISEFIVQASALSYYFLGSAALITQGLILLYLMDCYVVYPNIFVSNFFSLWPSVFWVSASSVATSFSLVSTIMKKIIA